MTIGPAATSTHGRILGLRTCGQFHKRQRISKTLKKINVAWKQKKQAFGGFIFIRLRVAELPDPISAQYQYYGIRTAAGLHLYIRYLGPFNLFVGTGDEPIQETYK